MNRRWSERHIVREDHLTKVVGERRLEFVFRNVVGLQLAPCLLHLKNSSAELWLAGIE